VKKIVFCVALFAAPLFTATARGQGELSSFANGEVETSQPAKARAENSVQTVLAAASALPEADTVIYINPQRILNDALPKFMSEKDLAEMRSGFGELKQNVGIDPQKVDYILIATRFRKPSAELSFIPPEFMIVAGGDVSAESLLVLARMASGGKLRDEKYGTKTIAVMTIEPLLKQAQNNPLLKSFTEVAIVPLNTNTIAVGSPAYLRAAVDAAEGTERINRDFVNSLLRDPTVLISVAGSPLSSFRKTLGLLGTGSNSKATGCETSFGDFYAALTMDANNFLLRGAMNADNPDTAKIMNNLLSALIQQAVEGVPDKTAQSALKNLSFQPQESEVVLRAEIPQQTVLDLIKKHPKPKVETTSQPKPATRSRKKRVLRQRTKTQ